MEGFRVVSTSERAILPAANKGDEVMKYLSIGSNAKTVKSDKGGEYLTAIMYMMPSKVLCPMSELAQCSEACLVTAGRGAMSNVSAARQKKSDAFLADPVNFIDQLCEDIIEALRKASKLGVKLAVRLNGTSDIAWENQKGSTGFTLMETFPEVQFYDYTKLPGRQVPSNYHLVASYSGANPAYAAKVLKSPLNWSVVFSGDLPSVWNGRPVVNGDLNDLIFMQPSGVVIGLSAKGKAKKDTSGFVVNPDVIAIAA